MKLTIALIAAARANKVARQADDSDRRYSQLVDMMSHYNNDFDERKYWAYGCNCLILGNFCPSYARCNLGPMKSSLRHFGKIAVH